MQVQVRINEEGTLHNQRYAFTDRFTLISELLQSARRASPQRIEITYDAASCILRVIDDGCGITDFQKLLPSVDPKVTLDLLVQELKLEKYPLLRGQSFRLTVGYSQDGHMVEVMPPAQLPTNAGGNDE